MTDIKDNPDLASDLSAIAMNIIKSSDPDMHGKLQEAFAVALAPFEAENQRLREALAWYGEQARLARLIHSEGDAGRRNLEADGGSRARAALRSTEASHDD